MKFLLIAALTSLPTLAHAKFVCSEIGAGPDHGYMVSENEEGNVELLTQSIAGPRPITTLDCHTPEGDGRGSNVPRVTLICLKPGTFRFTMSTGGVVGMSASLSRVGWTQSKPMNCRYQSM